MMRGAKYPRGADCVLEIKSDMYLRNVRMGRGTDHPVIAQQLCRGSAISYNCKSAIITCQDDRLN
ncbi:hypothetical protein E2C01_001770 [Portunus trituberculatus]|uniref:Uncharacterized protein n=1 Tax=Portunus trituberculatus TaxID=210409 RepID=A0A5B7CL83_PORTR|nr:hypothetical protein [Portunus trituberculatus]